MTFSAFSNYTDPPLCHTYVFRNLSALSRQLARRTEESVSLSGRHCLILCFLVLLQLFINYVFT